MDLVDRLRPALAERYAIQGEIGRGGMAIVFLAHELRHNRNVAVKVLKPEVASAVPTERFIREIQIEASLKHPYILPLFDSGDAGGLLYYVMPYVEGESLRARLLQETQLPLDEALRITGEIAEALTYAHRHGFVHCDVKPGNILLDGGHALLADFGIARVVTALGSKRLTESGLVVGTPEYMSPEQASMHGKVDGRSDIYALGCVLYEMLSGEPPFTGPTAQSIIARHMYDEPRSLRVVRSTVPEHVELAIRTALAKVPADRFATAGEFVAELGREGEIATTPRVVRAEPRSKGRRAAAALGGLALVSGLALWQLAGTPEKPLDPNKLVLFPLTERAVPRSDSGVGYDVAIMLSAALEHARPLKWIDGARHLGASTTGKPSPVSAGELRNTARAQGAGYYIDGLVLGGIQDSATVILRLHDTKGDSIVTQESASAPRDGASPIQLGLTAAIRLLPALVDPGRSIDLSALSTRSASATALWIQGEREFRRSRFRSALDFYQRAVREDSAMVLAALKGAQAASWEHQDAAAQQLVVAALDRDSLLPSKHQAFARGLQAYLNGKADTAVAWLTRALDEDSEWVEGRMTLGEVYYHLLPAASSPPDSMAHAEFAEAVRNDSGFAPPLFHLIQTAVRRGDVTEATTLLERLRRFDPDSSRGRSLAIMLACARDGPTTVAWADEAGRSPMDVLQAARSLAVAGAQTQCAEAGFRAVLADSTLADLHWGAFLGLHGVAMSQGRHEDVGPMIDSAVAGGLPLASALYLVDVLAGAPVHARAEAADSVWRSRYGEFYKGVSLQTRMVLAAWLAHRRDTVRLKGLRAAMLADTQSTALPLRAALDGHLALALGDTAGAVQHFGNLRVEVPAEALEWGLVEPMGVERLTMARHALARGDFAEAHRIAAVFDHPAPVAYLPYLPVALALRLRAAQGMERPELVSQYRNRWRRLRLPEGLALKLDGRP